MSTITGVTPPRFLIPTPDKGVAVIVLPDDEAHHARRVLRLRRGDPVRLFDGAGHEWEGRVAELGSKRLSVAIDRDVAPLAEPPADVTLAIGLLKGDQMDTVVRESTALGVTAITSVVSARVVAPTRARVEAARARWRKVAVQSAKQCGRARVPELTDPVRFDELVRLPGFDIRAILAEPGTGPAPSPALVSRPSASRVKVLLLVGPEGGWTEGEMRTALQAGMDPWQLGPRTIKAELAPAVALTALWSLWGWV